MVAMRKPTGVNVRLGEAKAGREEYSGNVSL
jgi:hypothetical protein